MKAGDMWPTPARPRRGISAHDQRSFAGAQLATYPHTPTKGGTYATRPGSRGRKTSGDGPAHTDEDSPGRRTRSDDTEAATSNDDEGARSANEEEARGAARRRSEGRDERTRGERREPRVREARAFLSDLFGIQGKKREGGPARRPVRRGPERRGSPPTPLRHREKSRSDFSLPIDRRGGSGGEPRAPDFAAPPPRVRTTRVRPAGAVATSGACSATRILGRRRSSARRDAFVVAEVPRFSVRVA